MGASNYLFPGEWTDRGEEYEAVRTLTGSTDLPRIQWRNFNIAPDGPGQDRGGGNAVSSGIPAVMELINEDSEGEVWLFQSARRGIRRIGLRRTVAH